MDKTASTSQLAPTTINRQFFQWVVKRFYTNVPENNSTKPDIPNIICLLQAIGFKLREFQKNDHIIPSENWVKNENVKITLECGTSKMQAVLEMDDVKCECPQNCDTKDCSFWSISGTDNANKIEETGCSMLPEMSSDTTSMVRDVVHKLIKIINNKCDINQNIDSDLNIAALCENSTFAKTTEAKEGLVRSYTDFYEPSNKLRLAASKFSSNLAKSRLDSTKSIKDSLAGERPKLTRQGTYELEDENESIGEPRPSPPKLASSPLMHQLCTSLGQISLQSDEEIVGLADYVVKAHQILDKAVNFIMKKLPLSNSPTSIQEEKSFVKPAPPPLMSSSFSVQSSPRSASSCSSNNLVNRSVSSANSSRPGSACSIPSRLQGSGPRGIGKSDKSLAKRTPGVASAIRDRSSSMSAVQRPQPATKALAAAAATSTRRRSTTNVSNVGLSTAPQGVAGNSSFKLPGSKLQQNYRNNSSMTGSTAKRRSPETKAHITSIPGSSRAIVSFLKTPSSTTSRYSGSGTTNNTSKFGYSASKK